MAEDMTGETGRNTVETSPAPSTSVTSQGFIIQGSNRGIINPINIQGGINTFNTNPQTTSPSRQERIEFNVQECIPTFLGREVFIKKLHEYICSIHTSNSSSIRSKAIVICGLGGVGKTQVVRKYIQEYKTFYDHVLWINAESDTAATSHFRQLASKLRIDVNQGGKQNTDQDIMEEVYDFLCKKFALLIYDNMESFPTADGKHGIHWLLPKAVKTNWKVPAIIITSRNRILLNFKVDELLVFDLSESLSFLSSLKFTVCENNRVLLNKVVEICQGLPLALQQVVSFVRIKRETRAAPYEEPYNLEDFLNDVTIQRKKFLKTRPEGVQYPDLFTLYDLTFEHIASTKHGKLALQCLDVMAVLNPDHISTELVTALTIDSNDNYLFSNVGSSIFEGPET